MDVEIIVSSANAHLFTVSGADSFLSFKTFYYS